jgi:tetratricopeptide (TPR) repeat protein
MRGDRDAALVEAIADEVEGMWGSRPPARLALDLEQRADELPPGTPGRAAWLVHAGELWGIAEDPDRARSCYERAMEDGGSAWIDPRASLVSLLLDQGDPARADEVMRALRHDIAANGAMGPVHDWVGEALEEAGRLREALRWYGAGLTYLEREDPERVPTGCLNGRYRVRRALELPRDQYDELCETERANARERYDRHLEDSSGESRRSTALTVLYWPPGEIEHLLTRWPQLTEDYGVDHDEHRYRVEQHLRDLTREGAQVSIGSGDLDGYLRFATRHLEDPAAHATRAAYAAELGWTGRTVAWPPGRNDPCWCASGRKYKKCCGSPTFGDR